MKPNKFIFSVKLLLLFLLFSLIITISCVSLFLFSNLPQQYAKSYLLNTIQAKLDIEANFQNIRGNLYSDIYIDNIICHSKKDPSVEIASIELVKIQYNFFKFLFNKGHLTNAIDNIVLTNSSYNILRNQNGKWLNITSKKKSDHSKKPFNFSGKIYINNLTLNYIDKKGWKNTAHPIAFETTVHNINGSLLFNKKNHGTINLEGTHKETNNPFIIGGFIVSNPFDYKITFKCNDLKLKKWGNYVIPNKNYHSLDGKSDIKGFITHKKYPTKDKLVLWHNINCNIKNANMITPFFEQKITSINGNITLSQGIISKDTLHASIISKTDKKIKSLYSKLESHNIIDKHNIITKDAKKLVQNNTNFFSKTEIKQVKKILKNPSFILKINQLSGQLNTIPLILDGVLHKNNKWTSLRLKTPTFNSNLIATIYPQLTALKLKNPIILDLNISGNTSSPTLKGNLQSDLLHCLNLPLKNVYSDLSYKQNDLSLSISKGSIFNGLLTGSINVSNPEKSPFITGKLFISKIPLNPILPTQLNATGSIDLSINTQGSFKNIQGKFDILGDKSKIYNQSLNIINGSYSIKENAIAITSTNIFINNGAEAINITALSSKNNISVHSNGKNILTYDPFNPIQTHPSNTHFDIHIQAPLLAQQQSLPHTLKQISSTLNLSIEKPYLFKESFDNLSIIGHYNKESLNLKNLSLKKEKGFANLNGHFHKNKLQKLTINIKNFELINIPFLTQNIPNIAKPFTGNLTTKINITQSQSKQLIGNGAINLKKITIGKLKVNSINSLFHIEENKTSIKNITLKTPLSKLIASGSINNTDLSYTFNISQKSAINIREIEKIKKPPFPLNGNIQLEGRLSGKKENYLFSGKIQSKSLNINNQHIENTTFKTKLSPKKIYISTFSSSLANGTLKGSLTLNTNQKKESSYSIQSTLKDLPLQSLQSVISDIQSLTKKPSNLSSQSSSIEIISPHYQKSLIPIYSLNNITSEIQFREQIKNQLTTFEKESKKNFMIKHGIANGTLSIKGSSQELPYISGSLSIDKFEINKISAKKTKWNFKNNKNASFFNIQLNDSIINSTPINKSIFTGSYTNKNILNIKSLSLSNNEKDPSNLIKGNISLPILKTKKGPHPINLSVNLNKDNSKNIAIINKQWKNISSKQNLMFNISGTLENPIITEGSKNQNLHYHITFNDDIYTDSITIKSPKFSVNQNNISLSDLEILIKTKNPISPSNHLKLSGNIFLDQLNLSKLDYLVSNVNLTIDKETIHINNDTYKGPLTLENSSLNGHVVIPLQTKNALSIYEKESLNYPTLKSEFTVEDASLSFTSKPKSHSTPLNMDILLNLKKNISMEGPLFGNNLLGISADLEFQPTIEPIIIQGNINQLQFTNKVTIKEGNISLLNRSFDIINEKEQQLYLSQKNESILDNSITLESSINPDNTATISPKLSLKSLTIIENETSATENIQKTFTHIIMSIDDNLSNLNEITFDIYESNSKTPINASELTFINQYNISNDVLTESSLDDSEITELIQILIPELYQETASNELITTITKNQINTFIRRSILKPFEKNISRQIGLNDLKIDYNVGQKLFGGTEDYVGIQFIKNIISNRLILRLKTDIDLSNKEKDSEQKSLEVSEIELSYFLLKNRNLSLNLTNYKSETELDTYQSKLSMRYQYEY
ncbi:hypothetical protein DID78_04990 [Candidatus Marinamargulisbacteria bacterium SCGC AG-343-D04]|nr:hypothetical protein DID78_04990 [Candidatus Marinamargulisbacteria bacterium SCGC AG-343-D04]